jgi:5'-3' exoribonuclease 1
VNQAIDDVTLLPEFDALYLDSNGIIHGATHGNEGVSKMLNEKDMMLAMFGYIDAMVKMIKPKKLLYMAIDGVAPRAKMNQQRSRRFRSARDLAAARSEAASRGEVHADSDVFDSNCITPGTEFMETVSRHMKFFLRRKLKEDPMWQGLQIIFSGHEVPGEGEHKIVQYIRACKLAPDYDPNMRHCMVRRRRRGGVINDQNPCHGIIYRNTANVKTHLTSSLPTIPSSPGWS